MAEKTNFEDKINELEEIARELEEGNLNLDESMKKFEDGMKLSKECTNILDQAEQKIMILVNENGDLKEEEYKVGEQKGE